MSTIILGIESSCDDTGASILIDDKIASNVVSSQIDHKNLGGVVPELASRKHIENIIYVVNKAIEQAEIKKSDISAIAFTRGPGLMGSLLVGVSFAKSMAAALSIPIIEVNHMEAHILALFIDEPRPTFPFLCLTVSGGHTQIVQVNGPLDMQILGKTIDDAAGEAFDKAGKYLGLPYPAGPHIDRLAQTGQAKFTFPKPNAGDLNFSFSGLKTAVLYFLQREMKKNDQFIAENLADICASLQSTIVDILTEKLVEASKITGIRSVAIAGGVSANSGLRNALNTMADKENWQVYIPKLAYCVDNAAMIAKAGQFKFEKKIFSNFDLTADPRLKIVAT